MPQFETSMNIAQQVLAAFQAEYPEHLEGIRTMLTRLDDAPSGDRREFIDQAFRLAHSLKGGARVCDLRPIEELGHRLEAVFEQIRSGSLHLDEEVATVIKATLDAVEDWMSAREQNATPAAPHTALAAIDRLLQRDATPPPAESPAALDLHSRLLAAFHAEYPRYVAELRKFSAPSPTDVGGADDWDEAYRLAHNLRASAEAADVDGLADVCSALESLLDEFRRDDTGRHSDSRRRLQQQLAAIERELSSLAAPRPTSPAAPQRERHAEPSPAEDASHETGNSAPVAGTGASRLGDTVRISTAGLDALLVSSRQLLTETLSQDHFGRELSEVRRQIVNLQREHESFRRLSATGLRRLEAMPEFNRVARYFENVDRDIRSLARRTQHLCMAQKRNARGLQSHARQIEQDVGRARMVPAETVYQGFRKMVRDLARQEGKQVELSVVGFDVRADRMVFQALKDPLIHMLRNGIVHGIETSAQRREAGKPEEGRIDLRIETVGNRLTVEVDDDGRGLDHRRIYRQALESGLLPTEGSDAHSADQIANLIYEPGFSTSEKLTEMAGRGMGLSVVREAVTRLQGDVQICRKDGPGTRFRISVPLSVSTHRLLLVALGEQTYAIPVHGIERLLLVQADRRETIEGKPVVTFHDRPLPLVRLHDLLRTRRSEEGDALRIAILRAGSRRLAIQVDDFLAERDLLIQDLDRHAAGGRYLGAVLLEDGTAALVLNPVELLEAQHAGTEHPAIEGPAVKQSKHTPRILVVDDSFTTRTLEKNILEANGYQVGIAVDGVEGLNQLQRERYDLVISDVEMPRMDGFALLASIKQDERLSSTPVVLVTSRDRREDQERGLDLGADAYIVKQKFDHQSWLSAIREIVGA